MLPNLRGWVLIGVGTVLAGAGTFADQRLAGPFTFFEPTVAVTARDLARLDAGDVIVRTLPADDGQIAVFGAVRLTAAPASLIEWTRTIEDLKRGPLVAAVGRFSDPIADDDLDRLVLESSELDDLKRCRVGSCGLKLAAREITEIQEAIHEAGAAWREAAARAFRRVVIARVRQHRDGGLLTLPPSADSSRRVAVSEAFSAIAARLPFLTRELPDAVNGLLTPGREAGTPAESFYYWSHERYGTGKPVVSVTYVRLAQRRQPGVPPALTVSTQLFASHYIEGAVGVTAVACGPESVCYLTYLNRTQVDFLGGFFGGLKRALLEGRLESDSPRLFRELQRRLESVHPGSAAGES